MEARPAPDAVPWLEVLAAAERLHQAAWDVVLERLKSEDPAVLSRLVITVEPIFGADDQDGP